MSVASLLLLHDRGSTPALSSPTSQRTMRTVALAWALSGAALAMLLSAATRMCIHARAVHRGTDSWPDPLFVAPPGDPVAPDDGKA